jgi:hypothetical protein
MQVLFTVTASLCIVCTFLGSGQLAVDIPPEEQMKGVKVRIPPSSVLSVATLTIVRSVSSLRNSSTLQVLWQSNPALL